MRITYDDIKHRLQPPLDCSEIKDLRGRYFYNRLITNYEHTDFSGCVLFHCYPSGILNSLEINPAQSEDDLTLKGANLEGAILYKANLEGADLTGANLTGAYLQYTDLTDAKLQGANLEDADLGDATLERANLQEANLERADLRGANLYGANLEGANLEDVNADRYVDFDEAKYNSKTNFKYSSITQGQRDSMIFVEDED